MLQKTQYLKFLLKTILLIIKIQNRQYLTNSQRLTANFDKRDLGQGNKKVTLNCSNRCETLYVTDSNTESVSGVSDDKYLDR